ncbi:MAG TPA: type II CAAX endopeptidase family protein [bacterium]|nr:type II CAAX endopeptidase family protein [bacterium]
MKLKRPQAITEILLFFAAFFLPGYAAQGSFAPPASATNLLMIQAILAGVPQFLLMAWVVTTRGQSGDGPRQGNGRQRENGRRPRSGPEYWGFVGVRPADALRAALLVLACFAAVIPFAVLVLSLPDSMARILGKGYRWGLQGAAQVPLAVLFGLTAGYREEFFFRAYLVSRLDELGLTVPAAAAVSTALFCLGHVYEGPLAVAVTAALGILLCVAWLRWKNLHIVAVAHGCYNALVLCLTLVLPRTLPQAGFLHIF